MIGDGGLDVGAADLVRRLRTRERERAEHLGVKQLEDAERSGFAVDREAEQDRAADEHARAPSASAFSVSVPRRTPPSISTGTRPATASTTSGSASRLAATPSSWRPP
jgi:hypothetical protein